jgi:hypothetical protein
VVVAGVRPLDACRSDGRTFSPNCTSNGLATVSQSFKLMTLAKSMAAPLDVVDREDPFAAISRCTGRQLSFEAAAGSEAVIVSITDARKLFLLPL